MTDDQKYWLIWFADHDIPHEMYSDKEAAERRFEDLNDNWTVYLFERIK